MSLTPDSRTDQSNARKAVIEAWVAEPDVKECRPRSKWRVRLINSRPAEKFEVEIGFLTREGRSGLLRVDNARRSDFDWVRKELESRNARLPDDKRTALDFVRDLIRKTPAKSVIACASPGWTPDATGFIMPRRRYGDAKVHYIWDSKEVPPQFGEIKGNLSTYQKTVLATASKSPYVSLAVMIALAGPLLDYVERRRQVRLLPETAIFHFAAGSSSGKTTLAKVAQSVFGSPEIDTDYEASDRGLAESAYHRNNLALVIDDTESSGLGELETFAKVQKLAQHLPRGRSKAISTRSARNDLPSLHWSCNAISTGPETVAEMATRLRRKRQGDRARILDIKLPSPEHGGVFGSSVTASRGSAGESAVLVEFLETWLPKCHGVLFDAWINYLIENDASSRLIKYFQEFATALAGGANGLEQRFAKKLAILYAAGRVGVESGLLPWPGDWPMRAVRHCYENSLEERDPDVAAVMRAVRRLAKAVGSRDLFPRVLAQRGRYPTWNDSQIGFHRIDGPKCETFLAKERLELICDDFDPESAVFQRLLEMKVVKSGAYESASEQLRVRSPEGRVFRIRLWKFDAQSLARLITPNPPPRDTKVEASGVIPNSPSSSQAMKSPKSTPSRR
jgi:Domain of unknown function (DUF927)